MGWDGMGGGGMAVAQEEGTEWVWGVRTALQLASVRRASVRQDFSTVLDGELVQ